MSDAEKILKMIESLKGYSEEEILRDHVETLDEIDARVWCYWNNLIFDGVRIKGYSFKYQPCNGQKIFEAIPNYSRSRDALKAIRPEGWFLCSVERDRVCVGECPVSLGYHPKDRHDFKDRIHSPKFLPTEELAELHCIIQAIEHERTHDERD